MKGSKTKRKLIMQGIDFHRKIDRQMSSGTCFQGETDRVIYLNYTDRWTQTHKTIERLKLLAPEQNQQGKLCELVT